MDNDSIVKDCFEKVGYKGKYQIFAFLLLTGEFLGSTFLMYSGTFIYIDPIFICNTAGKCNEKIACQEAGNDYRNIQINQQLSSRTITTEYQLYCDRAWLKSLTSSLLFVGCFLGTILAGQFTEKIGRVNTNTLFWSFCSIGTILLACSDPSNIDTIYMIMVGMFLGGFGVYPCNTVAYVILSEQSLGRFRTNTSGFALIGYNITEFLVDWAAYSLENNWKQMAIFAIMIPMVVFWIPNFLLIESPRYFLSKGEKKKAIEQFNKYGKVNKKQENILEGGELDQFELRESKKYTMVDLFRFKSLRTQVIAASYIKFIMMFVLYGSNFAMGQIGLGIYWNTLLVACCELSAYGFLSYVLNNFKRRWALATCAFSLTFLCFCFIFFPIPDECSQPKIFCTQKYLQISFFSVSRFFSSLFFQILGMYYPEIFPTSVRGMATMFIRGVGCAGSIFSPYVVQAVTIGIGDSAPIFVMGAIGITTVFPFYFLRETFNKPLEEYIEEEKSRHAFLQSEGNTAQSDEDQFNK